MDGNFYNSGNGFSFNGHYVAENIKSKKDIKSHAVRVGLCILVFLSAPFVLGGFLGFSGLYNMYSENLSLQYCIEMLLMVAFLFFPFFCVYLLSKKKDKEKIALSLEKPSSPFVFVFTIPMGLMLCFAGDYASSVIASLFEQIGITLTSVPDFQVPTSGTDLFLFAFSTIVPPAIIEEFALRSVTMQPLRKYGDRFAIIMTALVFGLMHRNAVQGIFAFFAGIVFGYITIAANSVWPAIIVHALNNSFSVIVSVLNEINEEKANTVYGIVIAVVMATGILSMAIFFLSSKRNKLRGATPVLSVKEKIKAFLLNIPMVISMVIMILYTLFGDL